MGCYTGELVVLNESTGAKFHKARPVPYALQKRVENALQKMEKDGVIERVSSATSAASIVTVGKKDGDEVRVCGDFSVTYNSCANVETYPMPKIEDMHSALRCCTVFSVLDLKQVYHQIPVSKDSQKYLTINTYGVPLRTKIRTIIFQLKSTVFAVEVEYFKFEVEYFEFEVEYVKIEVENI